MSSELHVTSPQSVDNISSSLTSATADSKNHLRRKHRFEQSLALKKQRKLHEKETKIAKAKAQGRDLEQERREMEANRLRNVQKHGIDYSSRGLEKFQQKLASAKTSFQICLDCSFENAMTDKEIGSLSSQIRYCYSINKKSNAPVYFSVTGLSGKTWDNLSKVSGFPEQWLPRAFSFSSKCFTEALNSNGLDTSQSTADNNVVITETLDRSRFVYLTSDSDTILDQLDDSKIYIIGGIVDRNRLKGATFQKALQLGISTAKLPIEQYLQLFSTKVLCCNHVFEILLKCKENGYDWKKAMMDVLPARKEVKEICYHQTSVDSFY